MPYASTLLLPRAAPAAAAAAAAAAQNANNVLVSSCESSPNGLVAKLADLGLSRVINQHRTHRTTHTVR
jgi:hypothetical protein